MPCLNTRTLIILLAISQLMIACSVPQQATKPAEGESLSLVPQDYDRAIGAIKAGKISEAEKLFSNIASSQPEFSNAHTNLGLIYLIIF